MTITNTPIYILLSTYNGEKHIEVQLNSILCQSYKNIHILIRDDGSSDQTIAILKRFSDRHSNISIILGKNIGTIASFITLLRCHKNSKGYFAFCDQDDIWLPDKITRAISILEASENPKDTLYFSRLALVNQDGKHLQQLSDIPNYLTFNNALIENVVTGATAVFGSGIKDLMLLGKAEFMVWHDWWLYLVATAFGKVIYDTMPTIYYRRHNSTQTNFRVRSSEGVLQKCFALLNTIKRKRIVTPFTQATNFGDVYRTLLTEEQLNLIALIDKLRMGYLKDKLKFIYNRDLVLNNPLDNCGLRILVLLGLNH